MEIRKRENPGHDICVALSQADQERKKEKRFRLCRCFGSLFQVIKFTMPYIFVRSSMNPNGLFSNQTFIDFENVVIENGEALGTVLSTYLGSQLVIGNASGNRLEVISQYTHGQYHTHAQNYFQTHRISDRPPHVVLNKLEGYGYKVVAANSQRPTGASVDQWNTGVSYTVWTLHKPL